MESRRSYRTYGARPRDLPVIGAVLMEILRTQTPGGATSEEAAAWKRSLGRAAQVAKLTLADPSAVKASEG